MWWKAVVSMHDVQHLYTNAWPCIENTSIYGYVRLVTGSYRLFIQLLDHSFPFITFCEYKKFIARYLIQLKREKTTKSEASHFLPFLFAGAVAFCFPFAFAEALPVPLREVGGGVGSGSGSAASSMLLRLLSLLGGRSTSSGGMTGVGMRGGMTGKAGMRLGPAGGGVGVR
jgi:hypothetical protein